MSSSSAQVTPSSSSRQAKRKAEPKRRGGGGGTKKATTTTTTTNSKTNTKASTKAVTAAKPPIKKGSANQQQQKTKQKERNKKKKKCYCCNPYTFWCFRDYPIACTLIGIAAAVCVVWNRFYALPVTAEQPCPQVVLTNCNQAGQLCDQYDEEDCEDNARCDRIASRMADAGRWEETTEMCGADIGFCIRCVNADERV